MKITKTTAAAWFGVSERRLMELVDEGVLARPAGVEFDAGAVVAAYVAHIKAQAGLRSDEYQERREAFRIASRTAERGETIDSIAARADQIRTYLITGVSRERC